MNCPRCATALGTEDAICPHCGSHAAPAPNREAPLPPRYEIKVELGTGGMGRVYLCRDRDLDVDVAVKVLPPEIARSPKHLARIEAEAKVAARLRGLPGILALYGFERHGEACLLVMEYAAGGSVFDRMTDQKRIPEAGCRRVGAEVADALAQAHGRGVLHRDIKPGNVLLDIHGRVKVADFGLAHVVEGVYAGPKDVPLEGTPAYMPPEVLRGEGADGTGCDCIHAVTDMDPLFERNYYRLTRFGFAGSEFIVQQLFERNLLVTKETHSWLNGPLGLCDRPTDYRTYRERPKLFGKKCHNADTCIAVEGHATVPASTSP